MSNRILIVEDEPAIADAITYALATDGFEPLWCATGACALETLAADNISLVILDVGLPDSNGFELFRELQAIVPVPVIFLTARSGEIDRVVGLELGADDYVAKPFSPRELTARVRSVLRRTRRNVEREAVPIATLPIAPEPSATHLPFVVDAERQSIRYFGHALDLARYEYRLLKILIGRPGRVYTRQELMDLAWEAPDHSFDRTVDAHIKTVRAKLRAVRQDLDPIKTHRGTGYSLKEEW